MDFASIPEKDAFGTFSVATAKVTTENVPNADFPERSKDSEINF